MFTVSFDAQSTLLGGQSFVWQSLGNGQDYLLHEAGRIAILLQKAPNAFETQPVFGFADAELKEYFNLLYNQSAQAQLLNLGDKHLTRAINNLKDFLLLKQDFETVFLTFILSSNNNIKRIRASVYCLTERFGNEVNTRLGKFKLFPGSEKISLLSEKELKQCGLGYRAAYLKESAKLFAKHKNNLQNMRELQLAQALKEFSGIGDKVADCIAVFSGKAKTFSPIDVHAKRILKQLYGVEYKHYLDYRKWFQEKFQDNAALAGQFLFEYYRK